MRRWAIIVTLLVASCAFESEPCTSNEECPEGTTCRIAGGADLPFCIASEPSDAGEEGDDGEVADDEGDPDSAPPRKHDVPDAQCLPDDQCGADEPNEGDAAVLLNRHAVGCPGFDLEFWDDSVRGTACVDDADDYTLEFVRCENQTFKVTATLTPLEFCAEPPTIEVADGPLDCDDEDMRCEQLAGYTRITALIRPKEYARPLERFDFRIRAGDEGATYELRTTVSQ